MRKRKNTKIIPYILRKITRKITQVGRNIELVARRLIRTFVRTLLRTLMGRQRRPSWSKGGFVLPTVTMVMLVVVLLTIAISLRSFDRAQDARNVRVSQAVLSAATPALDRARAKIEELLVTNPPTTGTPNEETLKLSLEDSNKFTFNDETVLTVQYDIDNNSTIEDNEKTQTAWRFNADTDADGTDDSYTIYGIFFLTPDGNRARSPLEARVPPMGTSSSSSGSSNCPGVLATSKEWIPDGGKLKKSFFVYAVTVPMEGSTGVSALEYQQDWSRTPLTNNAVVYEDDLEIAPGPEFHLNGRIFTNSNLIIAPTETNDINLHLVSSPASCFYDDDNSNIIVGGNVIYGIQERNDLGTGTVNIDLMNGPTGTPTTESLTSSNDSVGSTDGYTNVAQGAAYNAEAYSERLNELVDRVNGIEDGVVTGTPLADEELPQAVQDKIDDGIDRNDALETYFKALTRKVPNAETSCLEIDSSNRSSCIGYSGTEDELRPEDSKQNILVLPDSTQAGVNLDEELLEATNPATLDESSHEDKHYHLGDRIAVGNNLPQKYWDTSLPSDDRDFTTLQTLSTEWLKPDGSDDTGNTRTRTSQVQTIADVGSRGSDGFWEQSAADKPENASEGIGGLRVITGAGIYDYDDRNTLSNDRTKSFLPPPPAPPNIPTDYNVVWPDTMPMSPLGDGSEIYDNDPTTTDVGWVDYDSTKHSGLKGDLQMRATVLYHYAYDWGENRKESNGWTFNPQKPIACISSYYDPSTAITAANTGRSNNGKVYPAPTSATNDGAASYTINATVKTELEAQAKLVFPDGRLVNEPLKVALEHYDETDRPNFTLADQAAIDAELCAYDILYTSGFTEGNSVITGWDEGDIREVSFLDARQVKAIDIDDGDTEIDETFTANAQIEDPDSPGSYIPGYLAGETAEFSTEQRLPLEERQPLEIRVTQLNLDALRQATLAQTVTGGPQEDGKEYLLPMSGVIYASRNDALPDRSDPESTYDNLRNSPYDLKLDPSRRPNGFMLIEGEKLARGTDGKSYETLAKITQEKGLIFVSPNPVYIQGDFNLHEYEEFTEELATLGWSQFYDRSTKDKDFACRKGDPRFTGLNACAGDPWRAATVLADSITLLSQNWETGYRNDGDFDLRNNGGNGIVGPSANQVTMRQKRQFNGFFANNYVTNGLSSRVGGTGLTDANYTGNTGTPTNSSYFNNFVTPVQRRINFPEYVMEVCPKLPVSACEPEDWVVGEIDPINGNLVNLTRTVYEIFSSDTSSIYNSPSIFDSNGVLPANTNFSTATFTKSTTGLVSTLASGTTAITPAATQRFPRRVAFLRNEYGALEMSGDRRPIPIGVFNDDTIRAYPYANSALPRSSDNALWFRTTTNSAAPFDYDKRIYAADEPLFYLSYKGSDRRDRENSGIKPILPPTPTITIDGTDYDLTVPDNRTTPANEELIYSPYRFSMCVAQGDVVSRDYLLLWNDFDSPDDTSDNVTNIEQNNTIGGTSISTCPAQTHDKIQEFRKAMTDNAVVERTIDQSEASDTGTGIVLKGDPLDSLNDDTNGDGIVVYDLPGEIGDTSGPITITFEGDSNTVFIMKRTGALKFKGGGVIMDIQEGVDPNNIFWILDSGTAQGVEFENASETNPHRIVGNFICNSTNNPLIIGENTKILGGRFLGFLGGIGQLRTASNIPNGVDIRAMTSQANPSLVPVLQIYEPDATAAVSNSNLDGGSASNSTAWMIPATSTTFNLVVGSGDVPARPGQGNGGLQNFVRLLENWQNPTQDETNISGSFIQVGRSEYATAPQQQILREHLNEVYSTEDAAEKDYALFGGFRLKYQSGAAEGILGFQTPPERNWGFDVGLLSQPPDLFALKFTLPSTADPDEYFREVGIDDPWIRGLLCAEPTDHRPAGTDCTNYE